MLFPKFICFTTGTIMTTKHFPLRHETVAPETRHIILRTPRVKSYDPNVVYRSKVG